MNYKSLLPAGLLCLGVLTVPSALQATSEEAIEAMADYLMFVDYGGGTIRPEQTPAEDWQRFLIVDARDAGQFEAGHIPGAINIEWRQILDARSELPSDQPILLYCNTGTLSAQAGFALRVAGMENVRILQDGFRGWEEAGGFEAHQRAVDRGTE